MRKTKFGVENAVTCHICGCLHLIVVPEEHNGKIDKALCRACYLELYPIEDEPMEDDGQ